MAFHVHCPKCKELVFLGCDIADSADEWIYQCPHCKKKFSLKIDEKDEQGFVKTILENSLAGG